MNSVFWRSNPSGLPISKATHRFATFKFWPNAKLKLSRVKIGKKRPCYEAYIKMHFAFVLDSAPPCWALSGLAIGSLPSYLKEPAKGTKAMGVLAKPDLPPGANPDWTIPQGFERYSEAEHRTWTTLYERQAAILPGRACDAFLRGLDALDLHGQGIPDFRQLNEKLSALTGWQIVAVPGLVPDAVFFDHLANRRFSGGQLHSQRKRTRLSGTAGHIS